ncbi:uncharacterized protein [Montipora capricornis]|uniref:uncharacterized protein n=1 Tax=Montipora capricornis TaxID=246305 RepID=UPI0035F16771
MAQPVDSTHKEVLADIEEQILTACNLLQRQAAKLRDEQDAIDSLSKKFEGMDFSSAVKLNVGGHHFTTTVQTLTKDPNSMLAAMFSGRFEMKPSKDGSFFIDRDGTYFRFILNFLRDGKLSLPEGATFLAEIAAEAEFYQIQGIMDELDHPAEAKARSNVLSESTMLPFEESDLLNAEHREALNDMLPYSRGQWRLLFKASRDGFEAKDFHSKCDKKGATVTVVKSGSFIFGGFTSDPWPGSEYMRPQAREAFLFSLVNPYVLHPVKMQHVSECPHTDSEIDSFNARHWNPPVPSCASFGPVFGMHLRDSAVRFDLKIVSNANIDRGSRSHLGGWFECPEGMPADRFLTGSPEFPVVDYEVFGFS